MFSKVITSNSRHCIYETPLFLKARTSSGKLLYSEIDSESFFFGIQDGG
jgi:hypothetical protein